jgi:hypothetical protein
VSGPAESGPGPGAAPGAGRAVRAKQGLALVGLLVVLVGIALDNRMVVWVAIALLAGSVAIRFALAAAARRRGSGSEAPPEGE